MVSTLLSLIRLLRFRTNFMGLSSSFFPYRLMDFFVKLLTIFTVLLSLFFGGSLKMNEIKILSVILSNIKKEGVTGVNSWGLGLKKGPQKV